MIYDSVIINTFNNIKLNHTPSISKDKGRNKKKRMNHVKKIIKRNKVLKEANTIIITNNGIRKTFR